MHRVTRIGRWLAQALSPSPRAWRAAAWSLWILGGLAFALLALGYLSNGLLPGPALALLTNALFILLIGAGSLLGLWLLQSVPWRIKVPLALALPFLYLVVALPYGVPGGLVPALGLSLGSALAAAGAAAALRPDRRAWARAVPAGFALIGAGAVLTVLIQLLSANDPPNPAYAGLALPDAALELPNPGEPGPYAVSRFSYGSGKDRHRSGYADDADWVAASVDGRKLLDGWEGPAGWARRRYWGFGPDALPLQGRVWAPEGDGPFPLVLIVHGNHAMEDFSDPGYAYLGEHLASHGFILVSVDENFLNGSAGDDIDPRGGGLEEENDARGWLLLEHLTAWRDWAGQAGHPFEGRVDLSRIGLIGHSRGGEAVATAAAFNTLGAYPDDATLRFDYGFDIGAVIAIAPVDGQYRPRAAKRPLIDVNYFVIHGSEDGDVRSFMGASQFQRTDFSGQRFRFKASLYVGGANHGQFNTGWGRSDAPRPWSLFLDRHWIMPADDQRRIAKVYFTAVLEAGLNDRNAWLPLLRDPRAGGAWLPQAIYVADYRDSRTALMADYEEDLDPTTAAGGRIEGTRLTRWSETLVDLKWNPLDTQAAHLAWDSRVEPEPAAYTLVLDAPYDASGPEAAVRFAAAWGPGDTKPKGWTPPDPPDPADAPAADKSDRNKDGPEPLDWTVELTDAAGRTARIALSADQPLYPPVRSNPLRWQALSGTADQEVVLRRFALPLALFDTDDPAFDPAQISAVRFLFDRSDKGAILLDALGFHPGRMPGGPLPEG